MCYHAAIALVLVCSCVDGTAVVSAPHLASKGRLKDDGLRAEFDLLKARLGGMGERAARIAVLEAARTRFLGSRYEEVLRRMIMIEQDLIAWEEFEVTRKDRTLSPHERLEFLREALKGTAYEQRLLEALDRQRDRSAEP
jgi:hypothetical protein